MGQEHRDYAEEAHNRELAQSGDERWSCGCGPDYHYADCPILTDRFGPDEPEPFDPEGLDRDRDE